MFQTIKRMHPLSDYIIPKEKTILSHKTSSMDRAPGAIQYNQQIASHPNELAPLQGQLLPSLMETNTGPEMESLWTGLASSRAACWLDKLGQAEKRTGQRDLESGFSMHRGPDCLALGAFTESAKQMAWMGVYSRNWTSEHAFVSCIQRQCQPSVGPTDRRRREERKANSGPQSQEESTGCKHQLLELPHPSEQSVFLWGEFFIGDLTSHTPWRSGITFLLCEIAWNHSELFGAGRRKALLPRTSLCRDVYGAG